MGALHLHNKPYAKLWELRALIGGKVTTNIIIQAPSPPLADDGKSIKTVSCQQDEA
jgi:hypothetical protein